MLVWIDTEFIEDGVSIELLSIGAVREDGATYYAELAGVDTGRANAWVREHVLPKLSGQTMQREQVRADLVAFAGEAPVFIADYGGYDWVAICQLFGDMSALPIDWPMFCLDLQQVLWHLGATETMLAAAAPEPAAEHNALVDAFRVRAVWTHIARLAHRDELVWDMAP